MLCIIFFTVVKHNFISQSSILFILVSLLWEYIASPLIYGGPGAVALSVFFLLVCSDTNLCLSKQDPEKFHSIRLSEVASFQYYRSANMNAKGCVMLLCNGVMVLRTWTRQQAVKCLLFLIFLIFFNKFTFAIIVRTYFWMANY